jgi:hypothetical protein
MFLHLKNRIRFALEIYMIVLTLFCLFVLSVYLFGLLTFFIFIVIGFDGHNMDEARIMIGTLSASSLFLSIKYKSIICCKLYNIFKIRNNKYSLIFSTCLAVLVTFLFLFSLLIAFMLSLGLACIPA